MSVEHLILQIWPVIRTRLIIETATLLVFHLKIIMDRKSKKQSTSKPTRDDRKIKRPLNRYEIEQDKGKHKHVN